MIVFKNLKYQNFMSVGNKPISIILNDSKITVVKGANGHGKSVLLYALYYALYGKPFSNVKLGSLVNSINKKGLLVELSFVINGIEYLIKRGIKPNIFEIYIDGKLKPQTANTKDYQRWLQDTVLKMDEKTFRQIVIMGSSSFVPFMRLSASERRTVIEDLLNINIISIMNDIAKGRNKKLIESMSSLDNEIALTKKEYDVYNQSILKMNDNINESLKRIDEELAQLKQDSVNLINDITELRSKSNNERYNELAKKRDELLSLKNDGERILYKKENAISIIQNTLNFYQKDFCPVCKQQISEEIKTKECEFANKKKEKEELDIAEIHSSLSVIKKNIAAIQQEMDQLYSIETEINKKYTEVEQLKQKLQFFSSEKQSYLEKLGESVSDTSIKISQLEFKLHDLQEAVDDVKSKLKSYETILGILKDDGIKSVIIKNYLGIINALIAKYLNIIGFNVSFTFDSNFNETIKSRGRDVFEYNCFSEGERLRIDYCLLFTFRELAHLRSTVNCNLLVIDEQDGRLDTDGSTSVNTLLDSMKDNNIVIISQYPEFYEDIMTKQILMKKENHFTKATII